jgi:hypothetical protein
MRSLWSQVQSRHMATLLLYEPEIGNYKHWQILLEVLIPIAQLSCVKVMSIFQSVCQKVQTLLWELEWKEASQVLIILYDAVYTVVDVNLPQY